MGTWVGRYAIVGGAVREDGPWLAEQLRFGDEERVHLFVLADPADERSAEFCQEVAGAVADLFASESLSLTGGLLRALRQAHQNLAEWNSRSLREHRISIGVTCVALRGDNATVAQVGPGLVYIAAPDGVHRLSSEGHAAAQPLGGDQPLDPLFTGVPLEGTKILLLSSAAEQVAGSAAIGQVLAAAPDRALAGIFQRTREVPDMTAVLIADVADVEAAPAPVEIDLSPCRDSGAGSPRHRGSAPGADGDLAPRRGRVRAQGADAAVAAPSRRRSAAPAAAPAGRRSAPARRHAGRGRHLLRALTVRERSSRRGRGTPRRRQRVHRSGGQRRRDRLATPAAAVRADRTRAGARRRYRGFPRAGPPGQRAAAARRPERRRRGRGPAPCPAVRGLADRAAQSRQSRPGRRLAVAARRRPRARLRDRSRGPRGIRWRPTAPASDTATRSPPARSSSPGTSGARGCC